MPYKDKNQMVGMVDADGAMHREYKCIDANINKLSIFLSMSKVFKDRLRM